jgi:hypothetical protein
MQNSSSRESDKNLGQRSTQSHNDDYSSLLTDLKAQTPTSPILNERIDISPNSFEGLFGRESCQEGSPTRESRNSKIVELEKQIEMLKKQLTLEKSSIQDELSSISLDKKIVQVPITLAITDFTPEWDYLQGGSKVIICFKSNREIDQNSSIKVAFGDNIVDGSWIQSNVIKCFGII